MSFVREAVDLLFCKGAVEEFQHVPKGINTLTVSKKGKLRLVLDGRNLNKQLDFPSVKLDGHAVFEQVLVPGMYVVLQF